MPLDPAYPRERLAFMVRDAGVRLVLADAALVAALPDDAPVVELETAQRAAADCASGAPARRSDPAQIAYVIYTSGSTGKPKGVAIEHRSACTFVRWSAQAFPREDLEAELER